MNDTAERLLRECQSELDIESEIAKETKKALERNAGKWKMWAQIEQLEGEHYHLRRSLRSFVDRVERIAFDMEPPNPYTPQFVQICCEARALLSELKVSQ